MGYTELEYRYALDSGKPIVAFLHKDTDSLQKKDTEKSESGQAKYKEFREFAEKKVCKYWTTPGELGSIVNRSLIMLTKKHPGVGWVRADLVPKQEASLEILDLRKKVEALEQDLERARIEAPHGTEKLSQGSDTYKINYSCSSWKNTVNYNWNELLDLTWNHIFYHLSPLMINEASDSILKNSLNELIAIFATPVLTSSEHGSGHRFSSFEIGDSDFQTIKVQLRALGLINKSEKNRSVKDTETYWTLTPYGDSVMTRLRAIEVGDDDF